MGACPSNILTYTIRTMPSPSDRWRPNQHMRLQRDIQNSVHRECWFVTIAKLPNGSMNTKIITWSTGIWINSTSKSVKPMYKVSRQLNLGLSDMHGHFATVICLDPLVEVVDDSWEGDKNKKKAGNKITRNGGTAWETLLLVLQLRLHLDRWWLWCHFKLTRFKRRWFDHGLYWMQHDT